MTLVLRILLAVLLGVLTTALLDWAGWLTHNINVLFGIVVAIITFFSYDGRFPR